MRKINSIIFIFVLVFLIVSVYVSKDNLNMDANKVTSYVIKNNLNGDFPNLEQGTFFYKGSLSKELLNLNDSEEPDYIVIFYSKNIPGLAMKYNLNDKTIEAGLPLIKSPKIELLDGDMYEFIYTFKKNYLQKIFINGKEIISSPYSGSKDALITGFAAEELVYDKEINVDNIDIEFSNTFLENI